MTALGLEARFQLRASSGWRRVDTSLCPSPNRARHSSSSLPTSHSWMGSCCRLCCSPRAWACSVWLGTPVPSPPSSGKSLVPLDMHERSPQAGVGVCWQQLPTGLLPGLCSQHSTSSACGLMVSSGFWAMPGLSMFRQDPGWPWMGQGFSLASFWVPSPEPLPSLGSLCPVHHRTLLRKLGGLFLPPEANLSLDSSEGVLARAVVQAVSAPSGFVWGQARV